jgi:protein-S-isoprenylcysteine O-methyltransferase Ste14
LLLFPLVIALLVTVVISREERYLRGVFGSEYLDYCRRVNRWL